MLYLNINQLLKGNNMATLHSIRKSLIKKENLERFWKDLYPYQQDGIQRTMNDIEDNFKGQIILPTGSGKTRIMEYLTGELINKYNDICSFAVFCHSLFLFLTFLCLFHRLCSLTRRACQTAHAAESDVRARLILVFPRAPCTADIRLWVFP